MNICHSLLSLSLSLIIPLFHPSALCMPLHDAPSDQISMYPKLFIVAAVVHESQPLRKGLLQLAFQAKRHVDGTRPPSPLKSKT